MKNLILLAMGLSFAFGGALSLSAKTYYMAGDDSGNGSSMNGSNPTSCGGWTETEGSTKTVNAASAGNDYIVGKSLRTPTSGNYTFPGSSLTFVGGAVGLRMNNNAVLTLTNCTVTGSTAMSGWFDGRSYGLAGDIRVQDGGVLSLLSYVKGSGNVRNLTITAVLSGVGTLKLGSSGENNYANYVALNDSSLTDFAGPVVMTGGSKHTVKFLSAGSFPSEIDVADASSVTVGNSTTLDFDASGSFGEKRGVSFVTATPTIDVAEGQTVVFNGPTSGTVGFNKTGAGDLILSNDMQGVSGTVTVKAGRLFYKSALATSATITEAGGTAVEIKSDLKPIALTCEGYEGVADGQGHGITVTVTDPADGAGCTYAWSLDGGTTWSPERLTVTTAGRYTIHCRVTADGYVTRICNADVFLRYHGTAYVSTTGSATAPYDTPEKAARDIATAIDLLDDGQTVIVAAGTYTHANPVAVGRGISVRGPADRSAVIKTVGFSLGNGASVSGFTFDSMARWGTSVDAGCVVSNCLYRKATYSCVSLAGTIVDSEIVDCSSGSGSGAVVCGGATARMIRTKLLRVRETPSAPIATADKSSGVYMEDCAVLNCTNLTNTGSCGVFSCPLGSGSFVLNRCRFENNVGRYSVGRMGTGGSASWNVYATNCLFAANRSVTQPGQYGAAAVLMWLKNGAFVNCTIASNTCENANVALFYSDSQTTVRFVNDVMSDNGDMLYKNTGGTSTYDHTLYPDADGTSGNITGPAIFSKKATEPYRLAAESPGLGKGLLLGWTKGDIDLVGCPRVRGNSKVDMGCYTTLNPGMAVIIR